MKLLYKIILPAILCFAGINLNAQSITVTAPNGGEILYSCQQYPITWTQTGSPSNYWNIDYSLDGGTIWASVTSNFLSSNGTYMWTVPNVQSNTVLIRVVDALNSSTNDVSNALFTINIPVILTSPNGGEVWQGNTVHNITWNAQGTSNTYNLAYSVNNGSTWVTIVNNYSTTTGTYAWTVPSIALSTNCLVRVQDYVQNCKQDISNAVFTITPATPILLTPNGGEVLQAQCSYNITWNTATLYTSVRLDYSLDNGTTWTIITNGTTNDGSQSWTVPISPSTTCLVRISNYNDLSVTDVSNATFTIAQPITLTSPNGGETLVGCASFPITWTKSNCLDTWNISYSIDNGATYTSITNVNDNGLLTQTYNWLVPNGINSTTALIKVTAYYYNTNFDVSNAVFTIIPSNDITVTSPNGGENWQGLSQHTITWTNLPTASGQYTIQYSVNNGSSWSTIATNVTGNAYNWTVPNLNSSNCLVKVIDYVNTCKFDVSNSNFTISPAVPVLLTPNGGEVLQAQCSYNITWNTATLYTSVRLDYSLDNGTTWTIITNGTTNDGSQSWTVPISPSTTCLVRISNYNDLSVTDVSNATFTIAQPITVTSPNGGETLVGCASFPITWTKSNCLDTWNISYSIDNGATYTSITNVNDNGLLTQTYNWLVPNGINSTTAIIKVTAYYYNTNFDVSNAVFTIIPSNDITVTSPNGGENWQGLSQHTITWTNLPTASGQYTIQYSVNNGSSWSTIATNVTGNAYNWTIPNLNSSNCLVKVIDYVNTCKFDVSNANFTISPAVPILLTPNGGEVLQAQCSYNITWNTATLYTSVRLDYSLDNGTTWTIITNGTTNDGSQSWTVPISPSTTCLVRISNYNDLSVTDVSNATFTIAQPITVTSPNGGETLVGCASFPITWTKSNCLDTWNISYSIDNGATYTSITNVNDNGLLTQTYNWLVPNGINSTTAIIKVTAYYYNTNFDVSNAVFTIIPSNDITVTSPNGGENWQGLSQHTITWTNLPTASGQYTIQYSVNNGSSWSTIATNVTGNAYNWTVPNLNSSNCLVKVIDYVNTCKFDVSNANFTISPAVPVLLTPNGGEVLQAQCSYNITWNTATLYTSVRLDYSLDNGTTWTIITNGTTNDGSQSWTVPISPSTTCLVRISNYNDLSVTDVSNATFTIAQPITVTSPNGGETLVGCASFPITWTKSNCLDTWNISYSIDNGATYTSVTNVNDNGLLTQTYNWLVPNGINSTTAIIKVTAYYYNTNFDVSNAVFTIIPSNDITVTSPNGGENWQGLSQHTITWTNLPTASGQYTIQYSVNNGSSWSTIATNVTGNAYNWTIPNLNSSNCLVKVIDYVNTCKFDVSNANFTISPAVPVLLTPNGGEVLQAQCSYNITWNTATLYTSVRLDYSLDNGTTWTIITNGTTNDGSQSWTVPISPSTTCLVRISNYNDLSVTDVSNATFTIAQPITVTSPNGGETLVGCASFPITWTKSNCLDTWNISYSIDNGATYTSITNVNDNGLLTQTYNWLVPNGINSTTALIKVTAYYYNTNFDVSNAVFTIIPSNDITVTSPNGGENWQGLSQHTITWTNLPTASGQYTIQYSVNNGSSWSTIATNVTGNAYNWTIPNLNSSNCLVKVIDYVNTCKFDVSNANFTISPAVPVLISPNGGEVLYSGMSHSITWNTATLYTSVRLDYSLDNGLTWTTITNGTTNDGSQSWTVPNASSSICLVRISNYNDLSVTDVSNAVFTIKPAVTILTPNGDNGVTIWGGCTVTSITFDRSPAWDVYTIEYSTNNGSTWTTIINNWSTSANPATYNWTIPNIVSNQMRVRVKPYYDPTLGDVSDNTFTITKPVTIIQPNFGGIMQVGSTYTISWSSDGISNLYDIFYSTNGGSTFTNIVLGYNTSTNTYNWTVPNVPSTNCKIWVRDNVNSCKADTSDVPFTISTTAPAITLTSPNGINDTLRGCSNHLITWTDSPTIGTYDLAYSLNSGATWENIATNYATTSHSYNWVVPNSINSNQVLLRVRSSSNTSTMDLSDAFFSILPGSLVASPAFTTLCPGQSVQLSATGGSNYTWTPPTGLSASNISNPIASPATSTTYYVQSNNAGCLLLDTVVVNVTPASLNASVTIVSSATGTICSGTNVQFTASPTNGGTNPTYQWKVNNINVGTNSSIYSVSNLTNGDVVTCVLTSDIPCIGGNPATSNSITMTISPMVNPTVSISASPSTTICFGTLVNFTASSTNAGSAPTYQWKLNGGNVGTNTATFSSSSINNGDVVSLQMMSNAACLINTTASSSNIAFTVNNVPNQPGTISGSPTFCAGTSSTYSVNSVSGASSYTWTLPNGWTGTSTTNSITVTPSSNDGNIAVVANNSCGSSSAQSIAVTPINPPAQPGSISGSSTFCQGDVLTYSISAVTGATSYTWTLPNGWSGTSTSTSINTTAGATSGNISVTANSACGSSLPQLLAVLPNNPPAQPGSISGSNTFCQGDVLTYSIPAVTGASSYTWTLPNGWTGTSSSTSINTTAGATSGNISVTANSACGSSQPQLLAVLPNNPPAQPGSIAGSSTFCQGDVFTYSISAVTGASSYTWTLPNGWIGTSTSTSINTTAGATSGNISVTANGTCGSSEPQLLAVTLNNAPLAAGAISGQPNLCEGLSGTYTIPEIANAESYVWTFPNGWSGTSTSNTIVLDPNSSGGTISVHGLNACGSGESSTIDVSIVTIDNSTSIEGNTLVADQANAQYQWLDCNNNNESILDAIGQMYEVVSTGEFAVEISMNGCVDTSECILMTILHANKVDETESIKLYPNPTQNIIHIESSKVEYVKLFNALGMLVDSFTVNYSAVIDMSGFSNGIYFIQTSDFKNLKFIKQ